MRTVVAFFGKNVQAQVLISGSWVTVISRSDSCVVNNESIDSTSKSDVPWRQLVACGVRSATISISGLVQDSQGVKFCKNAAFDGSIQYFRFLTEDASFVWAEGYGVVASCRRDGEYNGAEQYSLSVESASAFGSYVKPPIPDPPAVATNEFMVALSLRRVVSPYSGPVVRLRRSSDNAEMDFYFDSEGIVDKSAILSFVGSGDGLVVRWWNQYSGWPLQYVQQTNILAQPRLVLAGVIHTVNSIPCIYFDGNDRYMLTPAVNQMPGWGNLGRMSGSWTFRRMQLWGDGGTAVFGTNDSNSGGYKTANFEVASRDDVSAEFKFPAGASWVNFTSAHNQKTRACGIRYKNGETPNNYRTRTNGKSTRDTSGNISTNVIIPSRLTNYWKIGCNAFNGLYMLGYICEIVATSKEWTPEEMNAVNAEQAAYFNAVTP